jgi:hypothetical protein
MATYFELYGDYTSKLRAYVQNVAITELSFMRDLSSGMQEFQKKTGRIGRIIDVTPDADGRWLLPFETTAVHKIVNLNNENMEFVSRGWTQLYDDISKGRRYEEMRPNYMIGRPKNKDVVGFSIMNRFIKFDRQLLPDTVLRMYVTPNLNSLSTMSWFWSMPDDLTHVPPLYNNWFPFDEILTLPDSSKTTRFKMMMATQTMPYPLNEYESEILCYPIYQYIMSIGNANYKVYEARFMQAIAEAKADEPVYVSNTTAEYNFGVNS